MTRPECPAEVYAMTVLRQFAECGELNESLRLKWILHRELSIQMDEDEFKLRVTKIKNKTL